LLVFVSFGWDEGMMGPAAAPSALLVVLFGRGPWWFWTRGLVFGLVLDGSDVLDGPFGYRWLQVGHTDPVFDKIEV